MIEKVNFGPDPLDPGILSKNLKELFPNGIFFRIISTMEQPANYKTDLYKLIRKNKVNYKEKDDLLLWMMHSDLFSALFPDKPMLYWDELKEAIHSSGCPVIRFFINKINEKFLEGFNAAADERIRTANNPVTDVAELFIESVFKRKTYFFDFDDSELFNICEHWPSSIYKVFEYYARKQYTLIRLGREFPLEDLRKQWKEKLQKEIGNEGKSNIYMGLKNYYIEKPDFISIFENAFEEITNKKPDKKITQKKSDVEFAWEIINELFINNLKIIQELRIKKENTQNERLKFNRIYNIEIMISETLERKLKENPFSPMDFVTLAGKISEQLGFVFRKKINLKNEALADYKIFSNYESQKIRKYYKFLKEKYIDQLEEKEMIKFEDCWDSTIEMIKMIHKLILDPFFKDILHESKEWIEELYYKIPGHLFSEIKQENKDGDVEFNYEPEENKYHYFFDEQAVIIEDRHEFARILALEFKEDEEKDFISFIEKDGPWPIILNELYGYYKDKGKHNDDSLLFTVYKHDTKNAAHIPFKYKIRKTLSKYEKELKEKENGKRI